MATDDLLDELSAFYSHYVILPEHGAVAMALWTAHAWTIGAAYTSAFLMFTSPEMRCGKSTAMALLYWTGPRTVLASNVSPAAIFRYIDRQGPTLLLDEMETYESEEARGILNSGHTRDTAYVIRCDGDDNEPKRFSTWAPKAVASIGKLAATLRDRAIVLPMKRKKRGQRVAKLRGRDSDEFRTLREKAARWASDSVETLKDAEPSLPGELGDRAADNWEPLIAIADMAGGDWPQKARKAATGLSAGAGADADTMGTQLLAAIKLVFQAKQEIDQNYDKITSAELAETLALDRDSAWATYGKTGKPITQRQIARLLEPYGVHPGTIRIGQDTKKGYEFAWLWDAFETYLDVPSGHPPFRSVTPSQPNNDGPKQPFRSVTPETFVTDEKCEKPNNDGHCDGVTDPPSMVPEERHWICEPAPDLAPRDQEADADRSCRWCGTTQDGTQQCSIGGDGYWLHPQCQKPFLNALTEGSTEENVNG